MAIAFREDIWGATVSGGATITVAQFSERLVVRVRGTFLGDGVVIWWTDDATSTGTTLFSASHSPWVNLIVSDPIDKSGYGRTGGYGFVVDPGQGQRADLHFSLTRLVSSRWKTIVFAGGVASDGFLDHSGAGRSFYAFAVDTSP